MLLVCNSVFSRLSHFPLIQILPPLGGIGIQALIRFAEGRKKANFQVVGC
jgi:hypothetical protein